MKMAELLPLKVYPSVPIHLKVYRYIFKGDHCESSHLPSQRRLPLTLLHSEWPKLYGVFGHSECNRLNKKYAKNKHSVDR